MEVYEAMRTTFAARRYTGDTIRNKVPYRILDNARFAPRGGKRPGWNTPFSKDKASLSIPNPYAVTAMTGIGKPVKQLTKLKRNPVEDCTWVNTFAGDRFDG